MRRAGTLFLLAALPVCAQFGKPKVTAVASIDQPRFSSDIIRSLERDFDRKLESAGPTPFNTTMGATRGVYIPGYGLVFTAELDLMVTPAAGGLLNRKFTPAETAGIHEKKLAQLPLLQQLMRDIVTSTAQKVDIIPDSEHVVFAVRLWYQAFEDQTRLPHQILMTADRKSAMAGQIMEVSSK